MKKIKGVFHILLLVILTFIVNLGLFRFVEFCYYGSVISTKELIIEGTIIGIIVCMDYFIMRVLVKEVLDGKNNCKRFAFGFISAMTFYFTTFVNTLCLELRFKKYKDIKAMSIMPYLAYFTYVIPLCAFLAWNSYIYSKCRKHNKRQYQLNIVKVINIKIKKVENNSS